jgi:hypothetical protein
MDDTQNLINQINRQLDVLKTFTGQATIVMKQLFQSLDGKIIDEEIAKRYEAIIDQEYNMLIQNFDNYARRAVVESVAFGVSDTFKRISKLEYIKPWGMDLKTINVLVKNMQNDFGVVAENGRGYYRNYIEFSKQGMLRESEIDQAVAKGFFSKGTGKGAKDVLKEYLDEKVSHSLYDRINNDSKFFKKIKFEKIDGMDVTDAVKIRLKRDFENKLKDDKFMFLVNKNGDVMTFKVDTYASLVARTRLGEAQVAGQLEAGLANGIRYYQVSKHNTKTKVCQPFEGKILTTNKKDSRYLPLNKSNSPLYHVNCQHRIFAIIENRETGELLD